LLDLPIRLPVAMLTHPGLRTVPEVSDARIAMGVQ
jgi:hypothetical protein